ncbi:cardiolipin synthase [Spizellomyces punctatus DAOM BR117]|uniref:CDP-diacylglycerol-glycerol-3-phosphate 3-phosphatidyltransferase n=1 Tax=Spizellomyces punctatus (strain DAOM BR117) TaxID=645134 RepID=A0A0L0HU14_SPIPD|nr:cardiolipin synthase [Spizellomyces punctatus DAOM BR117]KND04369.1 hypothetical protein SPPG_00098 [Spizellomyces punctatus DAOM BR117]|eukprot:XP_016612408.1 hypothetical protein SPPG_00098 [Spizellomyces punctatus DAOM BR117]
MSATTNLRLANVLLCHGRIPPLYRTTKVVVKGPLATRSTIASLHSAICIKHFSTPRTIVNGSGVVNILAKRVALGVQRVQVTQGLLRSSVRYSTGSNDDKNSTPVPKPSSKENIYTIPNALTVGRLVLSPVIGYLIVSEQFTWALGTLFVAGLSDLVDGFIARRYNMKTFLGSALDPAADKVLMTVLTVSLARADLLPLPLAVLILGRDVGLIAGTAYYRYKSLPSPKTVSRYFDLSLPSAEVHPPMISKINTLLQLTLMSVSLAAPVFGFTDWVGLEALRWVVGITTIWSGAQYALDKSVIKILPQPK